MVGGQGGGEADDDVFRGCAGDWVSWAEGFRVRVWVVLMWWFLGRMGGGQGCELG